MSRRKRRRRRTPSPGRRPARARQATGRLDAVFRTADSLIEHGYPQEAIELLEPLLTSYPRVADLHYYLGYARVKAGDTWGALAGYERALELSRDPGYWLPLASLYLELEFHAYALHAFRQVLRQQPDIPMIDQVRQTVALLEQDLQEAARRLGLPRAQVEKGLRYLEDGQRVLHRNDFLACIEANRQAIELLPGWPPPRNNLSLALFFDGQPEEAIATARQVLAQFPDNVQALSNAIRFLAWTGKEAEARALWTQLQAVTPQDHGDRLKMAEAAAVMNDDESVYQLLRPLAKSDAPGEAVPGFTWQKQLFLAVAEANLGRPAARRRLKVLQDRAPWAGDLLAALEAGRPGPAWAERFPYFHSTELVPPHHVEEFLELVSRQDEMPPSEFRRQVAHFVARFPQIVRMAEKMIWEDNQPHGGVAILATVATPAAHAALRRFGLSQAGDDETRTQALISLMQAGEITEDETLRIWRRGEWREVQLRQCEISAEPETPYSPQVASLLDQGLRAFQQEDYEEAERLFRRALELEPRAKEAYNNLGTIYARRGEHAQAREMYRTALEIDPRYVFPRCNLAVYLLDEDDVEGAQAMLEPLFGATRFRPQEMAFYSYTQARVLVERREYEAARSALQMALHVWPGYGPAEELLEHLDLVTPLAEGFESLWEQQLQRYQAARARLQARLSTPEPPLSEALALYTKDALTGMGRVVVRRGGWSALRKAELLELIAGELSDPDNLEWVVNDLSDEERAALRQVLAQGGDMAWEDFDARYGNDLDESPYWNWHVPETTMGRLRLRGLLVEATVDGELRVAVPAELRQGLREILG